MLSPPGVIACVTGVAIQLALTYNDVPKIPHFDIQVFIQIISTVAVVQIDGWGRKWWDRVTQSKYNITRTKYGDIFLVGIFVSYIQIICMLPADTIEYKTRICKILVPSILACTTLDSVLRIRNKQRRPLQANEQAESESEMLEPLRKADGESL